MSAGFKGFFNPITGKSGSWSIRELVRLVEGGEIDLDPPYQRDHVWTQTHQEKFLGFFLEGGEPPALYIRGLEYENTSDSQKGFEVIDGKQRVTALIRWWNNEIPALLISGRQVWKSEFDDTELRQLNNFRIRSVHLVGTDREIMEVYLRLNGSGIVHTNEELDKVRKLIEKI